MYVRQKPPRNSADLKASLEEMRKERLAKRDEREGRARASASSTATPSSSSGTGDVAVPNLREGGALGKFYEAQETNRTGPTWRETWVEATQRKVV